MKKFLQLVGIYLLVFFLGIAIGYLALHYRTPVESPRLIAVWF
jgi:hypothetical protein